MTAYDLSLAQPRVLSDLLPGAARVATWTRAALLVVGGAGFVGLSAQLSVHVPGTPVPVTGQTLAVLLVGAVLGAQQSALSMLLYLVAGGLGMPWFASGDSGFGGPTFGYVIGFVVAAALVGRLAERGGDRTPVRTVATMVLGTAVIYAFGMPWLAHDAHLSTSAAWHAGVRPFLAGDAIKMALAAGLLPGAWAVVRRVRH
jgi:biotin transport system substrate-specific component